MTLLRCIPPCGLLLGKLDMLNTVKATEGFAQEMLHAWKMAWEGQRLYAEAYDEANNNDGAYDENDPLWDRIDDAQRMQQAADDMTNAIEARALVAGVSVTDMIHRVEQLSRH